MAKLNPLSARLKLKTRPMSTLKSIADAALGLNLDARNIHFYQMLIRSVIVFFALLYTIRLAGRRFLANRNALDEDDLMEDLRLNGKVNEVSKVRQAQLERSGEISVIKNE
jgi:uncharacterized membrane protein YcaP (DUF421 family)